MIPLTFLIITCWLFYRLAWAYDKSEWKFAFIGAIVYTVLLLCVLYGLAVLFSEETEGNTWEFFRIELQIWLFSFAFDMITFLITFVPIAVIFFVIYKAIEYRWKQQESDKSKNKEELLDN